MAPAKATATSSTPEPRETAPINEQIAALAYTLWQERGCPDGSPEVDWFKAEEQLEKEKAEPTSVLAESR